MEDGYESLDKIAGGRDLRHSIDELNQSIHELLELFRSAAKDIKAEEENDLGKKFDVMIKHQDDVAKAMLLVLELMREHLPKISRHMTQTRRAEAASAPALVGSTPPRLPLPSAPAPTPAMARLSVPQQSPQQQRIPLQGFPVQPMPMQQTARSPATSSLSQPPAPARPSYPSYPPAARLHQPVQPRPAPAPRMPEPIPLPPEATLDLSLDTGLPPLDTSLPSLDLSPSPSEQKKKGFFGR